MVVICCRYGPDIFDMLLPGLVLQDMVLICCDMLQIYSDMHIFADMVMIWSVIWLIYISIGNPPTFHRKPPQIPNRG